MGCSVHHHVFSSVGLVKRWVDDRVDDECSRVQFKVFRVEYQGEGSRRQDRIKASSIDSGVVGVTMKRA